MLRLKSLRKQLPATLRLALPLVLAELGWMTMAIVDTVMVGHLPNSATAMGAVSLGSNIFIVLALFGAGLLMGLDTLVSQAFGAGQREDCHRSLVNSIYLSIALTPFSPHPSGLFRGSCAACKSIPAFSLSLFHTAKLSPSGSFLYSSISPCVAASRP